jgi:chitodextrinase
VVDPGGEIMIRKLSVVAAAVAVLVLVLGPGGGATAAAAAPDRTPPTTPTNVRVTGTTATSVTLAWNRSSDNSGRFSYVLYESTGAMLPAQQSQTTYHRGGLWPERTYTYTIQAVDRAGNRSGLSNPVSYTTPRDNTPPSAPVLTANRAAPVRVSVWWSAAYDDVSQVFYRLLVDGSARPGGIGGYRDQTLLDLTPSTAYSLVVEARDHFGNTSLSNTVVVTTPSITDVTPPSAPAALRGSDGGGCEAYLSWDRSTDDADDQMSLLYRLYVNGGLAPESMVLGVGRTVAYGRVPDVNRFVVEAVDGSGNVSAPSNELALAMSGC